MGSRAETTQAETQFDAHAEGCPSGCLVTGPSGTYDLMTRQAGAACGQGKDLLARLLRAKGLTPPEDFHAEAPLLSLTQPDHHGRKIKDRVLRLLVQDTHLDLSISTLFRLAQVLYDRHATGGSLHVWLDEGNWDRGCIKFCRDYAVGKGDGEAALIALLGLQLTDEEIGFFAEWEASEDYMGLEDALEALQ